MTSLPGNPGLTTTSMGKVKHGKKHVSHMAKKEKKKLETEKKLQYKNASMISKPRKSSKHKKIKSVDPFYVGNRGANKNAKRINMKPTSLDQGLSHSEKEFMRVRSLSKDITKKKLKGMKDPFNPACQEDRHGMTRKLSKQPKFTQGKRENDKDFMNRVNLAAHRAVATAQFHEEFEVEVDHTGKVIKKRTKSTEKNTKRLQEKKQRKKEKAKEKRIDKEGGFEKYKDKVEFGEVAMAPPQLGAKPRKAKQENQKPGVRSLLLKEIIQENKSTGENYPTTSRKVGETRKRKMLSMAQQVIMDRERSKAIDMYRAMKKQKMGRATT